ncbi:MAG: amino acid lyase [Bryobacterales bacterium]|nr:amino acid lyase [Bryobacterales bacterium]
MKRRNFVAVTAGLAAAAPPARASEDRQVIAAGDGIPHTAGDYAGLLAQLASDGKLLKDSYSREGVVRELERRVAAELGKEYAVWMPTGTLANHLAVRLLAGDKRRVLMQAESHLYNDCGDCAQTLSGLAMIPLAPGRATYTLEEVEQAASRAAGSRVAVPVGALQIESPVRRRQGEHFDFSEMKKITAWAREHHVGTHLDGARIFLESAYTGIPMKDYAALFDTVYVSMYKYFNAASGAVLAGPKALLENTYHIRRMFGGGLNEVWPFAAVALHHFDGFSARYRKAVETSEAVIASLAKDQNFEVERIANGTNIFRMRVRGVNALVYQQRLLLAGITVRDPANEWFSLQVNETWNRADAGEIAARFRKGLG